MMIAKKFYVSSLFSHPTNIDVKIKTFFVSFFCFGSFFMDTHVSPVIDILNFFVTLGFYFGLHNSVIGILEYFFSNFYFYCHIICYHFSCTLFIGVNSSFLMYFLFFICNCFCSNHFCKYNLPILFYCIR